MKKSILVALAVFLLGQTANACEPILPFIKVVGGPGLLLGSWVLFVAVVVKSVIFAWSQNKLSFSRALLYMLLGNVLTTVIGVLVAGLMGSGPVIWFGILIVWPLCALPAKRIIDATNRPWLKWFTADVLAAIMMFALFLSCILFGLSAAFSDAKNMAIYWILKLAAVYLALIVSIALTAFWEEWVVWKLSRCPADFTGYVQPVIRANLVVLLGVMLVGAGMMLPQRLKSPNFLVKHHWLHQVSAEVRMVIQRWDGSNEKLRLTKELGGP